MSNVFKALYFDFWLLNFSDASVKATVCRGSSNKGVLKTSLWTFIFATSALGLAAQNSPVQLLNFSSTLTSADIYVNGVKVADDLLSNTATPFFPVEMATTSVQVVVAASGSTSIADSLFSLTANLENATGCALAIYDTPGSNTPGLMAFSGIGTASADTSIAEISFIHLAPTVSPVHVLVRDGQMIVNSLGFGQKTTPIALLSADYYLDVKSAATFNIISTYRFSPQGSEGDIVYIYMVGESTTSSSFKLYAVHSDGFVYQVDFAPIATVQYVNAASDSVDVYKNGTRFADNAAPGAAMPFKYVPAGLEMNIAVASPYSSNPLNAYGTFPFTFTNAGTYYAVSTGRIGDAVYPVQMFFYDQARKQALNTDSIDLMFFNGAYLESSALTLHMDDAPFMLPVSYGAFTSYASVNTSEHHFELIHANGAPSGHFTIDFDTLAGQSIFLFTRSSTIDGSLEVWMTQRSGASARVWSETVGTTDVNNWLEAMTLFPNPVEGNSIYVKASVAHDQTSLHYSLMDIIGRPVVSGQLQRTDSSVLWQINTPPLPSGAYLLRVQDVHGQSKTLPLIK